MAARKLKRKYILHDGADINSVEDALSVTSAIKLTRGEFAVYRGQVTSKILRPKVFRLARWFRHERDMVRELISTHPQEFSSDALMLDRLVRMQHYGLPTRLLDVTHNFLAALHFATGMDTDDPTSDGAVYVIRGNAALRKYFDSDSVSLVTNLSNLSEEEKWDLHDTSPDNATPIEDDDFNRYPPVDRLLQFVRDEKPYFRSRAVKADLFKTYLVVPKKNNPRIIAQSGAFLVFGLVGRDRNTNLDSYQITRHRVRNANKVPIRAALEGLGINESSLFPEIDKAASRIAEQFRAS